MSSEVSTDWGKARGQAMYALPTGADGAGGLALGSLVQAFRLLQDRLIAAAMPESVAAQFTAELDRISMMLAPYEVDELHRHDARRVDLPGRGSPMIPAYTVTSAEPGRLRGQITFSRFHLGANGAVHGGVQPLLFDDILGRVVNQDYPATARTASLTANYRSITPVGIPLTWEATLDLVERRKRWASIRLFDPANQVMCDGTGLFIELRPGRP